MLKTEIKILDIRQSQIMIKLKHIWFKSDYQEEATSQSIITGSIPTPEEVSAFEFQ